MSWENDWQFRRIAELLWPADLELATDWSRPKGHAAAGRRMATLHEGFRSARVLSKLAADVKAVRDEMARSVS